MTRERVPNHGHTGFDDGGKLRLTAASDADTTSSSGGSGSGSGSGSGTPPLLPIQEDGAAVLDASVLDAGHGLDVVDEGGGVAGWAVDETELDGSLIPGVTPELGAPDEGVYLKQYQNAQAGLYQMKDGTARDPLLVGLGTGAAGTPATIVDDSMYNAWPQEERMRDGRVLKVWTRSNGHNLDNSGQIYGAIYTEALDGSHTLDAGPFLIASDATYGTINVGLGVLHSGRVVIAYNLYNHPTTHAHSVRVIYSDDYVNDFAGGWSAPYTLPDSFTSTCGNGTSRIVQRADGAVLLPIYGKNTGDAHYSAHLLFSTDDGATFGGEVTIANGVTDGREYVEPSVLVLDDQTVLAVIRTNDGGGGDMYQTKSTDGGATWAATSLAFAGYSPANMLQLSSGTVVSPIRGDAAAELELFTSIDRGVTWASQGIIATGFTELEYACPLELLNGNGVQILYSKQPTSSTSNADLAEVVWVEDVLDLRTSSVPPIAADVSIADAGGYYTGTDVEAALQEVGASLAGFGSGFHREVLMNPSYTDPPDPVTTSDGADWVYVLVAD